MADEVALQAALAALDAGTPFEEVARTHGSDVDAAQGGTQMTVVRAESSELARLGFSTPVGEVGGPLVQAGRFLLVRPEQRFAAVEGPWSEVGEAVEKSLVETPIDADRLEYAQWRAAMMRRYPIDLYFRTMGEHRIEVKIPEGMKPAGLPKNLTHEDEFVAYERLAQIENDRVVVQYTAKTKVLIIEPDKYKQARESFLRGFDAASFVVMFEPEKKKKSG